MRNIMESSKCPSGDCKCPLIVVEWVGNWWADAGRSVFKCGSCGWKWLEWN